MTDHEKKTRSYLLQCAKAYLNRLCVNTPRVKNVKLHGYKVLGIDDRGLISCTWERLEFDFTDTYTLLGETVSTTSHAIYEGKYALTVL